MSDSTAAAPASTATHAEQPASHSPTTSPGKGKAKATPKEDTSMEEDDEEEDEDDEMEEDDDAEDEEEDDDEHEAVAILPPGSRRARAKVDYASEEAIKKAGLTKEELDKEEEDEEFTAKDTSMEAD